MHFTECKKRSTIKLPNLNRP